VGEVRVGVRGEDGGLEAIQQGGDGRVVIGESQRAEEEQGCESEAGDGVHG
jgi:hypothetical protein